MRHSFIRWAIGVVAMLITISLGKLINVHLRWESVWGLIIFVPVFAIINMVIGPIVRLFSMPINCMTFGIFGLFINALMFAIAGYLTGAHMTVLSALFGSLCYTIISAPLSWGTKERRNS